MLHVVTSTVVQGGAVQTCLKHKLQKRCRRLLATPRESGLMQRTRLWWC